jgi:hypothetical protein
MSFAILTKAYRSLQTSLCRWRDLIIAMEVKPAYFIRSTRLRVGQSGLNHVWHVGRGRQGRATAQPGLDAGAAWEEHKSPMRTSGRENV